ncbi:protein NYNRIN-like [Gossypium australe]|uniref:Protein NYNRIN-like n=1 Tax=Gossypium australe TaxID=47621 RepID=A0A5B6WEC4_9ROSI|nr:protein NYNRIN-like [Gossypium australe]
MPKRIISDNALNFNNSTIAEVCSQFKIKHHNLSPYHPKMNGAVEVANKNFKKIMGKMIETYKDWHEKLPYSLYNLHLGNAFLIGLSNGVKKAFSGGVLILTEMDGKSLPNPVNSDSVKKYFT